MLLKTYLNLHIFFRQCAACLYIPQCLSVRPCGLAKKSKKVNATSTETSLLYSTCVRTAFYCVAVIFYLALGSLSDMVLDRRLQIQLGFSIGVWLVTGPG
jgi:hypothetical protein